MRNDGTSSGRIETPTTFDTDTPIIWFVLDAETLDFKRVSDGTERLLGIPPSQWLKPRFWPGAIHEDDRAQVAGLCRQALDAKCPQGRDFRLIDNSGRVVWAHLMVQRNVDEPGLLGGYVMACRHPTHVEQAASDRSAREALLVLVTERLNHQLRSISSHAERLERHLSTQRDDIGSEFALGMRSSLEALHQMLHVVNPVIRSAEDPGHEARKALSLLRDTDP